MKCTRCHRPLTVAALTVKTRAEPLFFGPKCAKAAGLAQQKERAPTIPVRRVQILPDERQADWVRQAQEGRKSVDGAVFGVGVVHG